MFKLIDLDNASFNGDDHPLVFSRGYACPEVYLAFRRSEEAKRAKRGAPVVPLKASAVVDIYCFGLLLALIGGNNAARHGRHGNYTALPAHLDNDAELHRLLTDQSALNEYVLGKKGERSEISWEHMKRKSWVDIISKMIAIDPKVRLQSLKDVIREFSIAITMRKTKIEELEHNNSFLENEVVKKISELTNLLQSSFESMNRSLREVVKEIPDNSQFLADLSQSIENLIDGFPEVVNPSDLVDKIDALHQELKDSTAKMQAAFPSESNNPWAASTGNPSSNVCLIPYITHINILCV